MNGVSVAGAAAAPAARAVPEVGSMISVVVRLLLAALVVYLYGIENDAFLRVFLLASAGFVVHAVLPLAWRLPFFSLLSIGGMFLVFTPLDALWLLATGGALIGMANLPVPLRVRAALLIAAAAGLAAARAGLVPVPFGAVVWPILGSMFMFRLVLYLMADRTDLPKQRGWWSVAYFFMLPNLVFPLFPVVDYQTFRRTYYDKDDTAIYETGLLWIGRGIVHLVLYRFIYHNLITDAESIVTLGDLAQFMLATLLLYLRVSGQFHLIVGLLHLFGFRLPETHKLYLLANSFTELWRRINIYWTDFMMKTAFYPSYFRLKDRGPKAALVLSTIIVFVTTWILHSYQWFWLRGGFPLTPQDTAFWAILGAFVVFGGLRELNAPKKPRRVSGTETWDRTRAQQTVVTFTIFCLLWSLWSIESISLWLWLFSAAATVDLKGVVIVGVTLAVVFTLGGRDWKGGLTPAWLEKAVPASARTLAPLALLLMLAMPGVEAASPGPMAGVIQSLKSRGLNARDLSLQHRGYYEQLDVRAQLNTPVDASGRKLDASWQTPADLGVLRERNDLRLRELLPSRAVTWNGHAFTTNRWGMRDRDYEAAKPADTLRIAILGPSHVMGNNVGDGEAFESLVEERLNREFVHGPFRRFEVLNFGVDGYSFPQQLATLEQNVFAFAPDLVIGTHYSDNRLMTEGFVLRVAGSRLPVSDARLSELIAEAGLLDIGSGGLPLPYALARRAARAAGLETRMPYGEAKARARRIANDVLAHSFGRFAELTRAHGSAAAILALNVVVDEVPPVPLRDALQQAGLPVFDLFDVYPAEQRPALRVAPWDDHPNAAGHRLIADRLYAELTAFIASGAVERARAGTAAN